MHLVGCNLHNFYLFLNYIAPIISTRFQALILPLFCWQCVRGAMDRSAMDNILPLSTCMQLRLGRRAACMITDTVTGETNLLAEFNNISCAPLYM